MFVICGIVGAAVVILCFVFLEESPRWLAMKGQTEKADKIVSNIEAKTAAKGVDVPAVPEEEIQRRENAEVVKDLPWSFLFKKSMITRTLTAMFLCFVMNVLVYTVISWTPTILKANGFRSSHVHGSHRCYAARYSCWRWRSYLLR